MTRQDAERLGQNVCNAMLFICRLIVFVIILHFAGKYWDAPRIEPSLRDSFGLRGSIDEMPDLRIPDPQPRVNRETYTGECKPATFGNDMMVCW